MAARVMTLPAFPAVDDVSCDLLASFGTIGLITPSDLADHLPYIRTWAHGGSSDRISSARNLDVIVFHRSINEALALAGQIDTFLVLGGPHIVNGIVLDTFGSNSLPTWLPYSTGIYQVPATYRVTSRRQ